MASSVSGLGTATAAYWFQFFLDAGIPPADAGNYAVTFTENRIQQDMIVDLTKEYLHEMGVTVLGDTIAILKHAKRVHTQATREKVLNGSGLSSATVPTGSSSRSFLSASAKVSAPVRPSQLSAEQISEQPSKMASQTTAKPVAVQTKPNLLCKKRETQMMSAAAAAAAKNVKTLTKKKLQDTQEIGSTTTTTAKGNVVRLKPRAMHEVPVPKVRNVTQEQEGGYKIIFPSGLVKKTKATAMPLKKTMTTAQAAKPSSVFDRLGQELIVDKGAEVSSTPLLVTGTHRVETADRSKATKGSTVFCRLGEKRELKRPGTENDVDSTDTKKKAKITVEDRLGPAKATMVPSASTSAGILSSNTKPDTRPVHLRLGNKSVQSPGVGEEVSTASGTCLTGIRPVIWSRSEGPTNATSWNDLVDTTATPCQKISFSSESFTANTGLTKRSGSQQKFKDDLVIHLESQNSGGAAVRRIGSQKLTGEVMQPTLHKTGNVMNRLGLKTSEGQTTQPKESGSVMLRLGSRGATVDQLNQTQKPVGVTVRIGSLKTMTSAAEESLWTVPAASKTGVFSRLGNRTSSTAV